MSKDDCPRTFHDLSMSTSFLLTTENTGHVIILRLFLGSEDLISGTLAFQTVALPAEPPHQLMLPHFIMLCPTAIAVVHHR